MNIENVIKDIIINFAFKKKSFRSFGYLLSPNN